VLFDGTMVISPLAYAEFVAPQRHYDKLVTLGEIPLHPRVHDAAFAYTQEFLDEVRKQMPQALRENIREMERILGETIGITVTDTAIRSRGEETLFDRIEHEADAAQRTVSIGIFASTIGFLPWLPRVIEIHTQQPQESGSHPLSLEKARAYSFRQSGSYLQLHGWYTHNVYDQGESLFHYLRTFAVLFNNHGLTKLEREK